MKAFCLVPAAVLVLGMVGCEQPQVVVEVGITAEGSGEVLPLPDLPVRLLPYDREAVLDSLEAASKEPQPPIPPELLAQQQQVQLAQSAWREAEGRLASVRDSIRAINERLSTGAASSAETLRARLQSLDAEEQRVNQEMQLAFAQFDSLQQETTAATDSIRNLRDTWAQQAFADFNQVIAAKLQRAGRGEHADTTDAGGIASFRAENGRWWVYARYTLPYEELYWNIPIDTSSDSTHVVLTRENAEVRPIL
jgi:hypothetical protein